MKKVLRRLGHVDANGVIQTKGRTACEINTANELVVVELIFTGVFNDLAVEQCVALLSCMTFDERNKDDDDPCTCSMQRVVVVLSLQQPIAC
jgi:ATP-dependent RNA helicase DOB1